jgi:thiosulfate/3-mercaptopyruvate sulfurtransferase
MPNTVYANPDALVSADWLAAHLDDPGIRVVEVDVSPKSYGEGHIPGAVFWNIYRDLKDSSHQLVDGSVFENILSTSGITPSTKVVFYGYGPVLGYWLLKLYRHPDVSVLNLSKREWQEDARPWTTDKPEPQAPPQRAVCNRTVARSSARTRAGALLAAHRAHRQAAYEPAPDRDPDDEHRHQNDDAGRHELTP